MSFRYLEFSCSECDFQDSDLSIYGQMYYQHPRRRIFVERQLGWCNACDGISPIEVLPSYERVEAMRLRTYPDFWATDSNERAVTEDDAVRNAEYQRLRREQDIASEFARLQYLAQRKSPPRCLVCGSTHAVPLSSDEAFRELLFGYDTPTPTGVLHPTCGGELLACRSDAYLSISYDDQVYDSEGVRIPQERPEPSPMPPEQGRLWD